VGGHNVGKDTTHNVLHIGIWCRSLFVDAKDYCKRYNVCQRIGKPFRRDELPLFQVTMLEPFDKWTIYYVGPINPPTHQIGVHYIIMTTEYLTRWAKVVLVKNCIEEMAA
jgi:hypothetical protein